MTRWDDHQTTDISREGIIQGNGLGSVDNHIVLILWRDGEGLGALHLFAEENDLNRRTGIDLIRAQTGVHFVIDIGIETLDDLSHKILRLELENLIGNAGLVNEVVITVQASGAGGVGRVLYDDGSIGPVHQS